MWSEEYGNTVLDMVCHGSEVVGYQFSTISPLTYILWPLEFYGGRI
jgi:hypothetical protein